MGRPAIKITGGGGGGGGGLTFEPDAVLAYIIREKQEFHANVTKLIEGNSNGEIELYSSGALKNTGFTLALALTALEKQR